LRSSHEGQSCLYRAATNWINVNADLVDVSFRHTPVGRYEYNAEGMDCVIRRKGDLAQTDRAVMRGGQAGATLHQWLEWSGVDLDREADAQAAEVVNRLTADSSGRYPRLRVSGLELSIRVQYFNFGHTKGSSLTGTLRCVIEVCIHAVPWTPHTRAVANM
jgi:hypothetical protein